MFNGNYTVLVSAPIKSVRQCNEGTTLNELLKLSLKATDGKYSNKLMVPTSRIV